MFINYKLMNKLFVILGDGHGDDTKGKWSPKFRTSTRLGDLDFLPGERFRENYFNDLVCQYIQDGLTDKNIPSIMLVPEKRDVSLQERRIRQNKFYVQALENSLTPVTISIHANGMGDGESWNKAVGVETFYKKNCEDSKALAKFIQKNVMDYRKNYKPLPENVNRGVKTANLYIFRNYLGITVLFEGEFMTNLESLKLLCSDQYQKDVSKAIVDSIIEMQGYSLIGDLDPKKEKRI